MKPVNTMKLQFEGRSVNESFSRTAVAAFVAQLDPTVEELADIKTAVSEAVTNCIVHGYRDRLGIVYISASLYPDRRIQIKVRDKGCGIPDIQRAMEPMYTSVPEEERAGLGFAVMQSLMDRVKVISKEGKGTTVTLERSIRCKGGMMPMIECQTSASKREETISNNIGLVHSCAHRFKGRGIEYDDLFQAGCMGLCKAADAFDEGRGVRFSTYAVPVILGEMRRLFRDGGAVKVSRTLKELSIRVNRERERLSNLWGREPGISELAQSLDLPEEQVVEAVCASAPPISLTGSDEDGGMQIDLPVESPEDLLSDLIALKQVVGELEPNDRKLIVLRYFSEKTQTQTAQALGMTQVQVSRREKKILAALRAQLSG